MDVAWLAEHPVERGAEGRSVVAGLGPDGIRARLGEGDEGSRALGGDRLAHEVTFVIASNVAHKLLIGRIKGEHCRAELTSPFKGLVGRRRLPRVPASRFQCWGQRHERCGESGSDLGQGRRRGLLRQSRHVGDAFRRRARPRRGHALRARPVRRRLLGRGRRLLPHDRQAGLDPAASRARASPTPPPTCTTPRRRAPASSTSWASTRSITSSTTRRSPPTSKASPGRSRTG